LLFIPRHDFFSLNAGALKKSGSNPTPSNEPAVRAMKLRRVGSSELRSAFYISLVLRFLQDY